MRWKHETRSKTMAYRFPVSRQGNTNSDGCLARIIHGECHVCEPAGNDHIGAAKKNVTNRQVGLDLNSGIG